MDVTLTTGGVLTLPDNVDDATRDDLITQAEAAAAAAKSPQGAQAGQNPGLLTRAGNVASAVDDYLRNVPSAAGRMAFNVVPDVLASRADALGAYANAIAATAERYGATPSPTITDPVSGQTIQTGRIPSLASGIKSTLGVPQNAPGSNAQTVENWLATAATLGQKPWLPTNWSEMAAMLKSPVTTVKNALPSATDVAKRLGYGAVVDAAGNVLSDVGGYVASAVDPRLKELGQTFTPGAVFGLPWEHIGSWGTRLTGLRLPTAGETYDAAKRVADRLGLPQLPLTAGSLGTAPVKAAETVLSFVPGANLFVNKARQTMQEGVRGSIESAADTVAPAGFTPRTEPGGPGAEFTAAAQADLNNRWTQAKSAVDSVENKLGALTTPTGEMKLVPLQSTIDALNGLRTQTVGGRTYNVASSDQNAALDQIIRNLRSRATPENLALHNQLQQRIAANQKALQSAPLSPLGQATAQAQIARDTVAMQANMKIPFAALRAEKSAVGARLENDSSLDYRADKAMHNALGQGLQDFANANGMGPQYQSARDAYANAMDFRDTLKNSLVKPAGTPVAPNVYSNIPGETTLSNSVTNFLQNPARAAPYINEPWFTRVSSSGLGSLDPNKLTTQWDKATPEGKVLMTNADLGARRSMEDAATLARAGGRPPLREDITHGLAGAGAISALAEQVFNQGAAHALPITAGGTAAGALLESPGALRALAGRPDPWWSKQFQAALPAIIAVAAQRQRAGAPPQ